MGEVVEMMLEGILCSMCGVYLGPDTESETEEWQPAGFPEMCEDCASE